MLRVDQLAVGGLPPVSFEVAPHECLGVEGPSGAGKTRLLRAIADLDAADGFVYLEGAERREVPAPEWRRRVRYASAEPAWWGPRAREHFAPSAKLDQLIVAVGLEPKVLDRPISELSTGERQRLGLARAIADEPRVLLLDEPTSALDAQATGLAEELIRSQILLGRMVVLVSHNRGQVVRLAHARLVLPGNGKAAVVERVAA
ncbi:MAG: ATP-binding cassette domain-containing protein [Hyphomicrobiaceae bacterium]|nr:ATP-binding cassette domain-containing protein [Hyphomicrobiaceae bacterium]